MKPGIIRALSLSVALTIIAAAGVGCGKKDEKKSSDTPSQTSSASKKNVGGLELPLVDKPTELTIWATKDSNFRKNDYNEKPSFQKMEEATNVKIKWQLVSAASANGNEQFNLLMNSGELPDMIYFGSWSTEASKYGAKNSIAAVDKYIDKNAPNLKKIMSDNPDVKRLLTGPDGHFYYFPNLTLDKGGVLKMFPQIRNDWLKKLNLKEPKTTDEWYNVLKAFKTQDPNGNGKDDEIPLVTVSLENIMAMFAPAFGVQYDFYVENGKVKYGPYDSKYKDALSYVNRLYSEKLLDPNYLVDKEFKLLTEKVTTDRAGSWFGWGGSYLRSFTDLMEKQKHPSFDLVGLEPPKGPKGDQLAVSVNWPVMTQGIAVSAQSKNIDLAVKWLDYQYSQEGIMLNNFGVENVSYDLVNGYPKFKDFIFKNPDGLSSTESLLLQTIGGGSWATVTDPRYTEQYDIPKVTDAKKKTSSYVDMTKMLPPLQFTQEENDIVVPLMADIKTYKEEQSNAFVMGKLQISSFDNFTGTLKKMNIEKVLEVYQKAYDRYMKAK